MNRIQAPQGELDGLIAERTAVVDGGRFSQVTQGPACCLFAPLHYEANYAYPLIVWLHGPDDDETQLQRIMPQMSLRNYVAVGPRGSSLSGKSTLRRPRYTWRQSADDVALAQQQVEECLALAVDKFHVHPDRVFVGGFDCGGTMAFRVALARPERFAGIITIGGAFPQGQTLLQRLSAVRRLPLFVAHGRDSQKYPPDQVCNDLRLFHAAGMRVVLRQYPCGHELTTVMLSDLNHWLMEQVTGAVA